MSIKKNTFLWDAEARERHALCPVDQVVNMSSKVIKKNMCSQKNTFLWDAEARERHALCPVDHVRYTYTHTHTHTHTHMRKRVRGMPCVLLTTSRYIYV